MTLLEQIKKQVSALPVEKQSEVLDFIIFLQQRVNVETPLEQKNSLTSHSDKLSADFSAWERASDKALENFEEGLG